MIMFCRRRDFSPLLQWMQAQHIPLLLFQLFPCHMARCSLCHVWAIFCGNALGFSQGISFQCCCFSSWAMFHPVVVTAGVRSSPSVRSSCTIFWMRKALCKWMPVSPYAWHSDLLCWECTASTSRGGLESQSSWIHSRSLLSFLTTACKESAEMV